MKAHSVFLRKTCVLPGRLQPLTKPVSENWTLVEEITALVLGTMIRQAGWHFMWLEDSCARRGFGKSRQSATDRALSHALKGIANQFNAAELESVQVVKYLGVHVATVTLQPRQIQQ